MYTHTGEKRKFIFDTLNANIQNNPYLSDLISWQLSNVRIVNAAIRKMLILINIWGLMLAKTHTNAICATIRSDFSVN